MNIAQYQTIKGEALTSLRSKLDSGYYDILHVERCLCGCTKLSVLAERDRDGLEVVSKLCRQCGLIHTDPRLNEPSMAEFYEQEYYPIIYGSRGGPTKNRWLGTTNYHPYQGVIIYQACRSKIQNDTPLVMEIGCGSGQNLRQFSDLALKDGKKTHLVGVEYASEHREMARNIFGIHELHESIGTWPEGKRVDVLILSHVLEHFSDLNGWLSRLSRLVTEGGLLFIEVPGVLNLPYNMGYCFDFITYSCLAHTYCFNLKTISFLLSFHGFEFCRGNERVRAVFRKKKRVESLKPPLAAVTAVKKMLTLLKESHYSYLAKALKLDRTGHPNQGIPFAREALVNKPDWAWGHAGMAWLMFRTNQPKKAVSCARKALAAGIKYPFPLLRLLGQQLECLRQFDEAETVYRHYLERRPWDCRPQVGLARIARLRGRSQQALNQILLIGDRWLFEPQAVLEEGRALKALGDLSAAREILEKLHSQYPLVAEIVFELAELMAAQNQLFKAFEWYGLGLKIQPTHGWGMYRISEILRDLGRLDEALARVNECLKLQPQMFQARLLQAGILVRTGEYEQARQKFQAIYADHPERPDVLLNISDTLRYQGYFQKALAVIDEFAAMNPEHPEIAAAREKVMAAGGNKYDC